MIHVAGQVLDPEVFLERLGITDPQEAIEVLCKRMEEVRDMHQKIHLTMAASRFVPLLEYHMEKLRSAVATMEDRALSPDYFIQWKRNMPELRKGREAGLSAACLRKHGHMATVNGLQNRVRKAEARR